MFKKPRARDFSTARVVEIVARRRGMSEVRLAYGTKPPKPNTKT